MSNLVPQWVAGTVRIRARAIDPYQGLTGHGYIAARNLRRPVQRVDAAMIAAQSEQAIHNILNAFEQWEPA